MSFKRLISLFSVLLVLFAASHAAEAQTNYCSPQLLSKACASVPISGGSNMLPYARNFTVDCNGFKVDTCLQNFKCLPCEAQFAWIQVYQGGPYGVGTLIMDFKANQLGDATTAAICGGYPYHRGAATFPDSVKYSSAPLYFYLKNLPLPPILISGNVLLNCPLPPSPTPTPTATPTVAPQIRITPIAECKTKNSNGTTTISFGYDNKSGFDATIPLGPLNNFNPGTPDKPLPTLFLQGRITGAVRSTYTTTPPRWNLNGSFADGGVTLPDCSPNQIPIAVAASSPPVCQQNGTVTVSLNASASRDPDNFPLPLSFLWTTNCSNATIANPSSAQTNMTITLINGVSSACSATVLVGDGLATDSASTNVSAAQCGGTTCVPDICGVCNGNGTTCGCTEDNTNIDKIDAKFHEQATAANKLARLLKRTAPEDKKTQVFVSKVVANTNVTVTNAWTLAWGTYGMTALMCSGVTACVQSDKTASIKDLNDSALQLYNNAKSTYNQIKTVGNSKDIANAKKRLQTAKRVYNENKALITALPTFTSTCN